MELPQTYSEQDNYRRIVEGEGTGSGIVFTSKNFEIRYDPSREDNSLLKCNGVRLRIVNKKEEERRKSNPSCYDVCYPSTVLFNIKVEIGFFDTIFGKTPESPLSFQDRLKNEISKFVKVVNNKEEHLLKLEESALKVVKCQLKIDKTISEIAKEINGDK